MALQGAAYLLHGQGLHACRPILQLVQGQIKPGQFGHLAEQFAVAVQTQGKAAMPRFGYWYRLIDTPDFNKRDGRQ